MPSQASTEKKSGIDLSPYSRFHAARKAPFAGRFALHDPRLSQSVRP
jgi:hypothetical protein